MRWRSILMAVAVLSLLASLAPAIPAKRAAASAQTLGYGLLAQSFTSAASTGVNWTKIFASWGDLEPAKGVYSQPALSGLSGTIDSARSLGLTVLVNIAHSPTWASNSGGDTAPPLNNGDLADFMAYLAQSLKGRVGAYEIWNEPNLAIEWGNAQPDPVKYAAMLAALYPRVKAADPDALVVTGGLSTSGDGIDASSYGDLAYVRDLYLNGNVKSCADGLGGLRSCFDALGSHPYGGPFAPETDPAVAQYTVGMYFRRAEQQKQMMDVWGADYSRGVFATEFNWVLDPGAFGISCSWGSTWDSYKLTGDAATQEATQADYLVRAFNYAYVHWPWMIGMITFNLDFNNYTGDGLGNCSHVRWYALKRLDGSWRPAYYSLASMAKPGIQAPSLAVDLDAVTFMLRPGDANAASTTILVGNVGGGTLNWSAAASGGSWLSLGTPSGGSIPANQATPLSIVVDKQDLSSGHWYSGLVTVSGGLGTENSPRYVSVRLWVGTVHRASLSAIKDY